MKKKLALTLACLAVLCASSVASAGHKYSYMVTVLNYSTYSMAYGAIGAARNSPDASQYIGCEMVANNSYSYAQCWARDASGKYLTCYNRINQGMKDAVAAISSSSYVSFMTDSADPTKCSFVQVTTGSQHDVPAP